MGPEDFKMRNMLARIRKQLTADEAIIDFKSMKKEIIYVSKNDMEFILGVLDKGGISTEEMARSVERMRGSK